MTIKRKTQLNLSGSHRTLDADNAFIGGFLFVTGSVSASVGVSASSGFQAGGASTFKAGTFSGSVSASNYIATANNLQVGQNAFVTGSLQVTGSIFVAAAGLISASVVSASVGVSASVLQGTTVTAEGLVSGSTGRFTYLSGALSASSTGQPFIVAGSGITTTFAHDNLNWTIAATGGGSIGAGDTFVQFNQNGAFAGSASFTHTSGTLGVHAISGSLTSSGTAFGDALEYNGNILKITSHVLVNQSAMLFDGVDSALDMGGLGLINGAGLSVFSGSLGEDPPFGIEPSNTPDQVYVGLRGELQLTSGSLTVNSGSSEDKSFTIEPSNTAGQVDVIFDRTGSIEGFKSSGINIRPLYSTGSSTVGQLNFILSGGLLASGYSGNNSVGKVDFSVIAVQKDTDNYAAWTFTATVAKDTIGAVTAIGYAELEMTSSGPTAANWDVNVNNDASIACSGSHVLAGTPISWYAQVTKKMFLSGSGLITY